jgi:hypothetical protein
VQADPNFVNFEQSTHIKSNINDKLNFVIDYLQTQNPPRYLTGEMKTYVKRMFANSNTDEQVFAYILEISSKIPFGILDPNTRKITTKIVTTLPVLIGVTPITKPLEKQFKLSAKSPKQSTTNPRQPTIPIMPTTKTPSPITSQILHTQNIINTQTQIPQFQTQTQNSQFQLPQSPKNYKSPINVPTISSPKINMQI